MGSSIGAARRHSVGRGPAAAIDRAHLKHQTLGNRELRNEVLQLFLDQCRQQLALLRGTNSPDERRMAAHSLVGAALAIGAFSVAECAAAIERGDVSLASGLLPLETAVRRARVEIGKLLAER